MANVLKRNTTDHAELQRKWNEIRRYLRDNNVEPKDLVSLLDEFETKFLDHCEGTHYIGEEELKSNGVQLNSDGVISAKRAEKDTAEAIRLTQIESTMKDKSEMIDRVWKIFLTFITLIFIPFASFTYSSISSLKETVAGKQVLIDNNNDEIEKLRKHVREIETDAEQERYNIYMHSQKTYLTKDQFNEFKQ